MAIQNKVIIETDSVSYKINGKDLVKDISFKVDKGDMVSIIGPNGSGKSTLIRLLSNEISPSSGKIKFQDRYNHDWDPVKMALYRSVLSQSSQLSFPFSVLDIVKMGRYPVRVSGQIEDEMGVCEDILQFFDLEGLKYRNYITLSGGEKQRVQLARVIAQIWSKDSYSDKLLILDEPTSYLDINHQYELFNFLEDLNNKGLTIIVVLHDLNHAILKSNKIAMLKSSELIKYGDIDKVFNSEVLKEIFSIDLEVLKNSKLNKPFITFKA